MGKIGWLEILLIAVLVLILFGHSKIPELAKNLAGGINVFKKELKRKDEPKSTQKKAVAGKSVAAPKKSAAKKK